MPYLVGFVVRVSGCLNIYVIWGT